MILVFASSAFQYFALLSHLCVAYFVRQATVHIATMINDHTIHIQDPVPRLWTATVDPVDIDACSLKALLFLTSLPSLN